MTGDSMETAAPIRSNDRTTGPETATAAERADGTDSRDTFQTALEAEVTRRIDAVERRWQSRKDRELNRARRRWESEAGQSIDPELLAWIAEADPQEVGQWLKAGLTEGRESAEPNGPASRVPESNAEAVSQPASEAPEATSGADVGGDPGAEGSQAKSVDPSAAAGAEGAAVNDDGLDEPGTVEAAPPAVDVEREAAARERLAERRTRDPSPDLFPSRGAPADAFQQIEAGFARGEVDLGTYETARRRRGLA